MQTERLISNYKHKLTAIILAGGRGTRVKEQDKGLLLFNGKAMIEYALQQLQPWCKQILISANRNQAEYERYGHAVINDQLENFQGPLAGIHASLKKIKTDYVITCPCDSPAITELYPKSMLNTLAKNPNRLICAQDSTGLQALFLLFPINFIDSLSKFLQSGQRKVSTWVMQQQPIVCDFSDHANAERMFENINTIAQLNPTQQEK